MKLPQISPSHLNSPWRSGGSALRSIFVGWWSVQSFVEVTCRISPSAAADGSSMHEGTLHRLISDAIIPVVNRPGRRYHVNVTVPGVAADWSASPKKPVGKPASTYQTRHFSLGVVIMSNPSQTLPSISGVVQYQGIDRKQLHVTMWRDGIYSPSIPIRSR